MAIHSRKHRFNFGGSVKRFRTLLFVLAFFSTPLFAPHTAAQFPAAPGTGPGLAETLEAIDSAQVTTRILYITAHPDDESAAILTYLARGLHADVSLLSLTRGEGGQNALGPEQAPQLGLIRTQELLAATRGYGVKLYFTRARDFGYSKTAEETEKIWGDQVLEDMVRVIRTVRPNIVINNLIGGHGHHVAAGLLTPKAVQLAADASAYPRLPVAIGALPLGPWGGDGAPVKILNVDRGAKKPNSYLVPVDEISPLYGKSYREIGLDAFTNHRTQGITNFINSPFLSQALALVTESGEPFDPKILAVPLTQWSATKESKWRAECAEVEKAIHAAHDAALALDWARAARELADALATLAPTVPGKNAAIKVEAPPSLVFDVWKTEDKMERALGLAAGLSVSADADRSELVEGEEVSIKTKARCRPEIRCEFGPAGLAGPLALTAKSPEEIKTTQDPAGQTQLTILIRAPVPAPDSALGILPEPPPLALIDQRVRIFGYELHYDQPVTHVSATSTRAERVPLRIVPGYTLAVEPTQAVEVLNRDHAPIDVFVRVHSYVSRSAQVVVGVGLPAGWPEIPKTPLEFSGPGDRYAKLRVIPPADLQPGNYTLQPYALGYDGTMYGFRTSLEALPSMPTLLWSSPAECVVHAFDVDVPANLHVGYISAESEPVPEALSRLGIPVTMLDAQALNFGDLRKFDAIVVGVRAYELRPELAGANQRLLEYVSGGGTLVVEYQRDFAWDKFQYAPYPAKIDSNAAGAPLPRITDENAAVTFLRPDDPLLNTPNKITPRDFTGWVQERGLYFWSQFDAKYTPLLAMHDPGEADLNGGLVYAHYGKGMYIYTGLAFFRQLPEGVPGAYRLFVNLVSATHEARQ